MIQLDAPEWCFPCGLAHAEPPVPPGLRLSPQERTDAWIKTPPRMFTVPRDDVPKDLRVLEETRKEMQRAAKMESLASMKDEHAERGERWDRKAKAWVRDEKLLQRMREREFQEHAAVCGDTDVESLQAEPIDSRASGEPNPSASPRRTAASVGKAQGSPESGGTLAAPPRSQPSSKGDKRRPAVAMPVVLPPPPPSLK